MKKKIIKKREKSLLFCRIHKCDLFIYFFLLMQVQLATAQTKLVSKRGGPALLGAFSVHSHEFGHHPAAAFSGRGVLVPAPGDVPPPAALALGDTGGGCALRRRAEPSVFGGGGPEKPRTGGISLGT